ncbi:MAG: P1 family peptidase [Candidatus Promineifilaceae bacterium]|jgi:D-aminopeptidase
MPRFDEFGVKWFQTPSGKLNAITDVEGVKVGHFTLIEGEGVWTPGHGPFRTGVTVILPHEGNLYEQKVPAAVHTINGFGKVAGFEQVRELGQLETPIALTGTLNVPRVADALMTLAIEENPHIGVGFADSGRKGYASVNPVVGETSDGFLSDIQARPIGLLAVRAARANAASGFVEEGAVGAGTGTSCFGWKGGIGTASRVVPDSAGGFTVGVLVQSNYGRPEELTMAGVSVGRHLQPPGYAKRPEAGSIMIIIATDAPLDSRQLSRLCHRAAFGLARTGSSCHGGSGDFVIAFSTAYRIHDRPEALLGKRSVILSEQPLIGALSAAVIESVEEAIYNSLLMAQTVIGRDGNTRYGLPPEEVKTLLDGSRSD